MKLVTSAWFEETMEELEDLRIAYKDSQAANARLQKQYRDLRDRKDNEIENLHKEIEYLKGELRK